MDGKHKLDAPNNESLRTIEQLNDHSELSTIYPHAGKQWEGDLVSTEERDRRQKEKRDTASFGIRKKFWSVGVLAPLPLLLLSVLLGVIFTVVNEDNVTLMVIPMMIVFLIWIGVSILIFRKVFSLFYEHGLRAMPFLATLVVLLGLAIQIVYVLTASFYSQTILSTVLFVCAIELVLSIIISYALLILWTTPKVSGGFKLIIIGVTAAALLVTAVVLTWF